MDNINLYVDLVGPKYKKERLSLLKDLEDF